MSYWSTAFDFFQLVSENKIYFFIKIPFGSKTSTVSGRATLSIMVIPSLKPEDSSDSSGTSSVTEDSEGFTSSSISWTADSELSFERWSTVSTWLLSVKGYYN